MLSIIEKVLALEEYELFAELTSEHLSRLAELTTEVSYKKGEIIFRADDPTDAMYFVLSGRVSLLRDDNVIATADAKSPFMGAGIRIFTGPAQGMTAVAASDGCHLLRLSQEDLFSVLYDNPGISIRLIKALAQKITELSSNR